MSQGIRHAPFPTFFMISGLIVQPEGYAMSLNRSYFQLYSPQPLMTETQLNFKSYFLQFVLCQYVKDLFSVHSP